MPIPLPQSAKKLLQDKAYAHVVTFNAQGNPPLTMVWMDVDGNEVLFNTAEGRKKPQNLRRDPRIIASVQDRNDPQAYAVFYGKARVTETDADDHIDKLAKRFLNAETRRFSVSDGVSGNSRSIPCEAIGEPRFVRSYAPGGTYFAPWASSMASNPSAGVMSGVVFTVRTAFPAAAAMDSAAALMLLGRSASAITS
jgi:PPOX class probable F420-dependent enzyme